MQFAHLKDMPALRWEIQNLQKLKGSWVLFIAY